MQEKSSVTERYPNLSKLCDSYFYKNKDDPRFIRITFRKTSDFIPESVVQIALDKNDGIGAIVGIVKAKKLQCSIAAIRFPKSKFSLEQSQQWVADHFSMNKD
jgi:hypothetical protein